MELFQQKKFKIKQHSCLIMEYNSVWIECIIGDNNIIGSNHTVPSVDKKNLLHSNCEEQTST